jgi:NADH dehydrogenase
MSGFPLQEHPVTRRASSLPHVLILGGGFAGLSAAQHMSAQRHRVTLVSRQRHFEFLPNIHELVSGVKTPDLLRLPLGSTLRRAGHAFIHDDVTGIDPAACTVSTQRRRSALGYDALIVALGGVDATYGIAGVTEHAMPFKSVDQCSRIARRLSVLAARRKSAHVLIVGGGLEGVEALGEILRRHRDGGKLRLTLIEARERVLPDAPAALDRHLRQLCAPFGVRFETGTPVRSIAARSVELTDGRTLPADLTIWTGGPTAPALLAQSGLAPALAWAPVQDTLQSAAYPQVFIAGDDADWATPLAKQAYHALDMGACAARNVERLLAERPLLPFRPSPKPQLVCFGDLSCFLIAGQRVLAGSAFSAGKEAVFELVMAQLDVQPWWQRLPRMAQRSRRAALELLAPSFSSLEALRRQGRVSVLAIG